MISNFNEVHPEINVTVEYLDYTNGDDQINTAIEGGQAPDIVLEGPERLVANWGARGLMADLSDMWTDEAKEAIYDSVESACQNNDGVFYEYPLCMTAHTMAINKDIFEKAVKAVYDSGQQNVGAVYCSGQGGDQGTRALVNNLYGGTFTNAEHTEYTVNSEENIKALELLSSMEGINFDASIAGGDEAKIEASKTFIDFMANDETQVVESVKASSSWPVKDLGNIYEGDDLMTEYSTFIPYMGDYYQVVGGWAEARTAWWNMLQQIGSGADVKEAVEEFVTTANAAAN